METRRVLPWLVTLILSYIVAGTFFHAADLTLINIAGPLSLGLLCWLTFYRCLRSWRDALWTPTAWFLVATIVYFSIGPVMAYWISDDIYSESFTGKSNINYIFWRTNLLNAVGTLGVALGLILTDIVARREKPNPPETDLPVRRRPSDNAAIAALVFISIGFPFRYLILLPLMFGEQTYVLPGAVGNLTYFLPVGMILTTYLAAQSGGRWFALSLTLFAIEFIVSILEFSKTSVLLALAAPCLGIYLAKGGIKWLVTAGIIAAAIYFLISPVVSEGRLRVMRQSKTGLFYDATLSQRLKITAGLLGSFGTINTTGQRTEAWGRLCYAASQIFAMRQYDSGRPGESFLMAVYTVVPRMLWSNKPIITDVGVDFTQQMYGHRGSSTGIGIYGEAYWNGGWIVVIISSLYIGALFYFLDRFAAKTLSDRRWFLFPCVFFGIRVGFRIDGWFAPDYVGSIVMFLGLAWLLNGIAPAAPARQRS